MKKCFLLVLVFIVSINTAISRELKITSHPFPPWQFEAADGSVQGINVDVLKKIAQKLSIDISFDNQVWARAWITTKGGGGDALISVSRKEPREPFVWFPPLGTDLWLSRYVFFTNKQNLRKFSGTYQDIIDNNLSVCIVNGYSYHKSFWHAFPYKKPLFIDEKGLESIDTTKYIPDRRDYNPLIFSTTEPELCFNLLSKNRIDVLISDESIGLYTIKQLVDGKKFMLKAGDIVSYPATLFAKGYPIAFAKNSNYPQIEQVGKKIWQELLAMQASGEYQTIVDRWLK